jgi:hypothetical protein
VVANKAHHPKQTEQIPAGQESKRTEFATSFKLLRVSPFLFYVEWLQRSHLYGGRVYLT